MDYMNEAEWKSEKREHILEESFRLFSRRGIEAVTMPEVAEACGVGRATLYRYYATKMELAVAVGSRKWREYLIALEREHPIAAQEKLTGAEHLRFFLDTFIDLYRNHRDILRYNYYFNGFLSNETGSQDQRQPYFAIVEMLEKRFHKLYEKGMKDGTLNPEIDEATMFSGIFHIMLATVTRYAVGLVYIPEKSSGPDSELILLVQVLLDRFTIGK